MSGALHRALVLLTSGNREVYFIAFTSIKFSLISTFLASIPAIVLGIGIAVKKFRGKRFIVSVLNSLMALPTVVIGLLVFSFLTRTGPLGRYSLLFTPSAVVIGQTILAFPIAASMVYSGLSKIDPRMTETLITLGASQRNIFFMTLREAKTAIASSVLAGFGRVIGEVGVSMILGGNIRWYTRTITTTIAMETSKGNFEIALALGIILILIAFAVNFALHWSIRHGIK